MPALDFFSMAVLIALNLVVTGFTLPLVMGSHISKAAKHGQAYFLLQACGWMLIMLGSRWRGQPLEPWISTLATVCTSAALWQMSVAVQHWLGMRSLRYVVWALCVAGPVGFAVFMDDIPMRLAWYTCLHGLTMLCLCGLCLYPQRPVAVAWRYLMAGCALVMACALLFRASVAAFTPLLTDFTQNTGFNHAFVMIAHLCGTMTLVSMLVAWRDEANQQLRDLAMTDQLTGLSNRHAVLQAAPLMQAMAQRHQWPLAVMLLDLDHFKAVNDRYGHTTGDRALELMAQVLRQGTRSGEVAARWGGEEFCMLLYATPADAPVIYQRLRTLLHSLSQQHLGFPITLSAGFAVQLPGAQPALELAQLLHAADTALYAAKSQGRDRLVVADTSIPATPVAPPAEAVLVTA